MAGTTPMTIPTEAVLSSTQVSRQEFGSIWARSFRLTRSHFINIYIYIYIIVKTRLCNKMADEFLSNNLVVYIEKEIVENFTTDSILDDFRSLKERKL